MPRFKERQRRTRPPSLLSLNIPKPINTPSLGWIQATDGKTGQKRGSPMPSRHEPPVKKKRWNWGGAEQTPLRSPPPPPPPPPPRPPVQTPPQPPPPPPPPPAPQPDAGDSWEYAEDVEPEGALPTKQPSKPLVPYTPSPTPSPQCSREPSPEPPREPNPDPDEPVPEPRHQLPGFDPSKHVELSKGKTAVFKKRVMEQAWNIKLSRETLTGEASAVMQKILACLQYVLETVLAGEDPETTAQVFISQSEMHNGHRASEQAMVKDLDLERTMQKLEEVVNSLKGDAVAEDDGDAEELAQTFWDKCTFIVVTRKKKPPTGTLGQSLHTRTTVNLNDFSKAVHSLRDPSLKSYRISKALRDSCLLNCTALALYKIRNPAATAKDTLKFMQGPHMKAGVEELAAMAGVPFTGPHDLAILAVIQQRLGDEYQIAVYKAPEAPHLVFGPNEAAHHINLFYQDGEDDQPAHVRLITSIKGFFGAAMYCEKCKKKCSKNHKCQQAACRKCMQAVCKGKLTDAKIRKFCQVCQDTYKTQACFDAHLKSERCKREKRCLLCWEKFPVAKYPDHLCGTPFCQDVCKRRHSPFEHCYVPTDNPEGGDEAKEDMWEEPEPPEGQLYRPGGATGMSQGFAAAEEAIEDQPSRRKPRRRVYADAETSCDPATGALTVSLIVLKMVLPDQPPRRFVYGGPRAGHDLVAAFIAKDSPFRHSTVVFHNGAKFDAHIVWRAALEMAIKVELTRKGGKIIKMAFKAADVVLMDSLLFLPNTPLSKFPEIFGLETGGKGHYPFKLTGTKLVDDAGYYLGEDGSRFPSFKDFLPDGVRPKAYNELRAWWEAEAAKYAANPELRYNLRWEELKYCEQDVDILMGGFETFRDLWLQDHPGMDVFDSMTLPQFINRLYRRDFMKPKSIAPLPPQGFLKDNNRGSVAAFCWLQLERRGLREAGTPLTQLRDARRGGEVTIAGVTVDGTGVDSTGRRHVYQFHGCWWHGCPDCATKKAKTLSERQQEMYVLTLERSARLRTLADNPNSPYGTFVYHEVWEHQFQEQVKQDDTAKAYWVKFKKHWPAEPLRLRSGFHGGRTNAVLHKVKVPKDHKLVYVDFTSLYPSVNYGAKGELYPVGFPKVFIGPDIQEEPDVPKLAEAFGFWKVKVHPPRQLYLPVLPMTVNHKLVFPLCRTCAEEERQGLCPHSREERALSGTYFSEELKKAVEMGYELDTPQEIWEWPKEQRTGKMFKKFIRELYAQKVLSSAKPKSQEEMAAVLEDVRTSVGLRLHPDDFKENKCQRAQAKFALNNIWGFHGKTGQPEQTAIIKTEAELEAMECMPGVDLTSMRILHGGEILMVEYKDKVEKTWRTGSMAVAAMTTGWARLRLYELLQEYEQHVVYFDTDSAFLLLPPGVAPPVTSSKLGDVKDEVAETYGAGKTIVAFVSLGPKSYAYLVVDEEGRPFKLEFKLKGVSLTKAAMEKVSMELMEQLVDDRTREVRINQWNITRDLVKARLNSHNFTKRLAFSSTKRWFMEEGPDGFMRTLPYGFTLDPADPTATAAYLRLLTCPDQQ